jgi:hypothetical protein
MKKTLKGLLLSSCATLAWASAPAQAQNPQCPTRPFGDSTNACASTAFVQGAVSGGPGGFVTGPASSVDGDIAVFSGTTGKAIRDSLIPTVGNKIGSPSISYTAPGTGGATITQNVYNNRIVYVADYMVCDGATVNAASTLQNAYNAANGGTLVFPQGVPGDFPPGDPARPTHPTDCIVSGTLNANISGTTILGRGNTLRANTAAGDVIQLAASYQTIQDLFIDKTAAAGTRSDDGIALTFSFGAELRNVYVSRQRNGVRVNNAPGMRMSDSYLTFNQQNGLTANCFSPANGNFNELQIYNTNSNSNNQWGYQFIGCGSESIGVGLVHPTASSNGFGGISFIAGGGTIATAVQDIYITQPELSASVSTITTAAITTPGTGYTNGSYTNVPLINTTGIGIMATANVTVAGGAVTALTITNGGKSYIIGNTFTLPTATVGPGTGFVGTVTGVGVGNDIGIDASGNSTGGSLAIDGSGLIEFFGIGVQSGTMFNVQIGNVTVVKNTFGIIVNGNGNNITGTSLNNVNTNVRLESGSSGVVLAGLNNAGNTYGTPSIGVDIGSASPLACVGVSSNATTQVGGSIPTGSVVVGCGPIGVVDTRLFLRSLTAAAGATVAVCQEPTSKEVLTSGASTCPTSSKRFKHDIDLVRGSALGMISAMEPISFVYNNDAGRSRLGFIAEQVASIDRRFGDGWDEIGPRTIDPNAILAVSVKALQELQERLVVLEQRRQAMPSTSPKQARLMAAAAHNPAFAKKAGVPQKVAKEFNQADAKTGILRKKRGPKK